MLDKKVVELLNQQVNKEFYSAYFLIFLISIMMKDWKDLEIGIRFRHRKNGIMRCFLFSICRITARK